MNGFRALLHMHLRGKQKFKKLVKKEEKYCVNKS